MNQFLSGIAKFILVFGTIVGLVAGPVGLITIFEYIASLDLNPYDADYLKWVILLTVFFLCSVSYALGNHYGKEKKKMFFD